MQTISKPSAISRGDRPLYVYLQRPDNGDWVTVGRYRTDAGGEGFFKYAPSYIDAGLAWAIDPKNLPFLPGMDVAASRYQGLHDAQLLDSEWRQLLHERLLYNVARLSIHAA